MWTGHSSEVVRIAQQSVQYVHGHSMTYIFKCTKLGSKEKIGVGLDFFLWSYIPNQ